MQFVVKRDALLKSLNFVQGVVEKKNTLPILSNVLLQLKDNKLSIVATDLDIVFYDEINQVKILKEGSTTTSAAILYDILRKISSDSELKFDLKTENKLSLKSDNSDFNLLCLPTDNFPTFADEFEGQEISLNNSRFLKLLNKTKISPLGDILISLTYLPWLIFNWVSGSKGFSSMLPCKFIHSDKIACCCVAS